jgi:hypothetical protein
MRESVRRAVTARSPLRRRAAQESRREELGTCVVYGNCQASALRIMLDASPGFSAAFQTVYVPAVHEITEETLAEVRAAVAAASLFVTQPVRHGYHGFPVGSEEIADYAAASCRTVTIPALYYEGLYPYQVYVRDQSGAVVSAPLSIYHDVRFLYCAAKGWNTAGAVRWLTKWTPAPESIRTLAEQAQSRLEKYEQSLDVQVSSRLLNRALHGRAFYTINHPTDAGLMEVVVGLHHVLDFPHSRMGVDRELLGEIQTPLEPSVIAALDLGVTARKDWIIRGESLSMKDMVTAHLGWYRENPGCVAAGLAQHELRLSLLGLGV